MERKGARFVPLTEAGSWKIEPHVDRTVVFADFDLDGDIDCVIAGLHEPLRVLRNDHCARTEGAGSTSRDDWLVVVPRDTRPGVGNRHAVGAEIRVTCDGKTQRRWIVGSGPFQSNVAPEAHFGLGNDGLGTSVGPVDVEVIFADGTTITKKAVARGTRVVMDRATP
jgi:hypothetical protein